MRIADVQQEPLDTTMPWLEERSAWQPDTEDTYPELDGMEGRGVAAA